MSRERAHPATATTRQHPFRIEDPDEPGRVVRGRVVLPAALPEAERLPHVLVLHGFKGFMDWGFFPELARRIAAAGWAAVCFNLSGSGVGEDLLEFTEDEAFARNTYSRELEDTERVHDLAVSGGLPGVDGSKAAILGHSRGGGVALLHAARHGDTLAVVTWAAIDDVDRFDAATKAAWRRDGAITVHNARTGQVHRIELGALDDVEANRERLDVLAAARRLRMPTLVLHGTDDTSVPPSAAERIHGALPPGIGSLLLLEGAGHTFGARHPLEEVPADLERAFAATLEHLGRVRPR